MSKVKIKVLLIEDNPTDALLLEAALQQEARAEYIITRFERLAEGLNSLKHNYYSVALLDLGLPDSQGIETFEQLNQAATDLPVIILSGLNDEELGTRCVKLGAQDYVVKSQSGWELIARSIRYAIERQRARQALHASEVRFRTLFENMLGGFAHCQMLYDANGNPVDFIYLNVNPAFKAVTGLQNAVGRRVSELIPNLRETNPEIFEAYGRVAQDGGQARFESFVPGLGAGIWFAVTAYSPQQDQFVAIFDDITERKQAEESLKQRADEFEALLKTASEISGQNDLPELLNTITARTAGLLNVRGGSIYLYDSKLERLEVVASTDISIPIGSTLQMGEGLAGRVAQARTPMMVEDYAHWEYRARQFATIPFTAIVEAPILYLGELIGVLVAFELEDQTRKFDHSDAQLLMLLANMVGGLVNNAREAAEREQANEQLQASEAKYRAVTESFASNIFTVDQAGFFRFANHAAAEALGLEPKALVGKNMYDIFPPPVAEYQLEHIRQVIATHTGMVDEAVSVVKSEPRWFRTSIQPLVEASGVVSQALINAVDITERKEAEQRLQESERRFAIAFHASPTAQSISVLQTGEILDVNQAYCELMGYTREELISWTSTDLNLWINAEDRSELIRRINLDAHVKDWEHDFRIRSGEIKTLLTSYEQIEMNGQACLIATAIDITERKKAAQRLADSESRYRTLFENTPVAIWEEDFSKVKAFLDQLASDGVTDLDQYFTTHPDDLALCVDLIQVSDVNQAALKLYETTNKIELIKGLQNTFFQGSLPDFKGELISIAQDQLSYEAEVVVQTLKGHLRNVTINWLVAPGYEDSYGKVLVSITDITERKRIENTIRESQNLYRRAMEAAGIVPYYQSYHENGTVIHYDSIGEGIRQITGYGPDEFTPQLWDTLVEDINLVEELSGYALDEGIRKVRSGEIPVWKCEHRIRARNGEIHWVFESAIDLRDANDLPYGSIGSYQDITARKLAEEELKKRGALLAEAQRIGHIGHLEWDAQSNKFSGSAELFEILELPPDTILNKQIIANLMAQADQERVKGFDIQAFSSQADLDYEYPIRLAGQRTRWLHQRAAIVYDANGRPARMIGTLQDITERKTNEINIQQRVVELEAVYENGLAINKLLEPKLICQKVVDVLATKLEWHHAAIRLLNPKTSHLEMAALHQPGLTAELEQEQIARLNKIISDDTRGLTGWVAKHHQPLCIANLQADPRYIETFTGMRSGLYVPIMAGERLLGVISVESEIENLFNSQSERLLMTLANQAAIALENAQLYLVVQQELAERQQTEERLRVSEENYRLLFELSPEGIFSHDGERITFANAAITKLVGADTSAQLINQPIENIMALAQSGVPTDHVRQQSERMSPKEVKLIRTDGSQLDVEISAAPIRGGAAASFLVTVRDITERKQAEQALQASKERFRALFENSPVAIWEEDFTDVKRYLDNLQQSGVNDLQEYFASHPNQVEEVTGLIKVLNVNTAAIQMYEATSREELIYQTTLQPSPGERDNNHSDFIAVAKNRPNNHWEGDDTTVTGRPIRIALSWSVAPGVEPDYSRVIVTTLDITERQHAEESLRASEERYRLLAEELEDRVETRTAEVRDLYDSAPCGYHSLDEYGRITQINQTELNWLGLTREEAIGHSLTEFLTADSREMFKKQFAAFIKNGSIKDVEVEFIRKNGTLLPLLVSATAVYDQADRYISSRSTLFDNTERKNSLETLRLANAEMKRALRTKDEFLANMSHELRTPLNAILGLSESLLEQTAGTLNEKQEKYLVTVHESGSHLLNLINDILDLAKVEAGQIALDPNRVDINAVCQASLRMIKQLAQKKNQSVEIDIQPNIGFVLADERRLKQMIVNLLSNAVKFTPAGGTLGLRASIDFKESKLIIKIWDKGIGIRNENFSKLFQPFTQLDSSLARESGGTGLGLTLVAQMARLHGGSVGVVSVPNQGSEFSITLPWDPNLTADGVEKFKTTGKFPALKRLTSKQYNILMVEDTESVIMIIKDYLELAGYKVDVARDGPSGIEKVKQQTPDLILMDVQMPGMDGLEATRQIRQLAGMQTIPIIAMTALAMADDRERCLAAGMNDYISKPVNLRALIKLMQNHLAPPEGTLNK